MYLTNIMSKKAFTIIEMLLVIAILGVLAMLGLRYIAKQSEQNKVSKASLQVQQFLQAGLAYQAEKGAWPICSDNTPTGDFMTNYVPNMTENLNPWGTDSYHWIDPPQDQNDCSNDDGSGSKFRVYTDLKDARLAGLLVNSLPNAAISNTTTVIAEVSPSTKQASSGGISVLYYGSKNVKSIYSADENGVVNNYDRVEIPYTDEDCPNPDTQKIMVFPFISSWDMSDSQTNHASYLGLYYNYKPTWEISAPLQRPEAPCISGDTTNACSPAGDSNPSGPYCFCVFNHGYDSNNGHKPTDIHFSVNVSYLVLCVPK